MPTTNLKSLRSLSPRAIRPPRRSSLALCFASLLAVAGLLSPASAPAALAAEPPADDPAAWLFSPAEVVEIDFTLPQKSIAALNHDPGEYQDGTFSLTTGGGEKYGPLDVGIRLKGGAGSFRPLSGKAAFKVKMSHSVADQRFFGLKTLTLNNMVQDRSMIHELLAYKLFRSAGVAAPRTGYAYLRVNAEDYGVYLNVETPDEVMLSRWFESTQHLYEGEYGTDVSPGSAGAFSVDEGSETDRSDLEALIAAVNGDGGDWSAQVADVADLEQMTHMWAVEKYSGHWDGYAGMKFSNNPNNYYLHSDRTGRFRMLPWGTDQTWVKPGGATWERLPFDEEAGLMFNKCLEDASCFALYVDAVSGVRSLVAGLDLDSLAANSAALLAPWQAMDPRREYSLEAIQAAVDATRQYVGVRPGDADAWLLSVAPSPPPAGPEPAGPQPAGPEPDAQAPETTITEGPKKKSHKRRVTLAFASTEQGSSFECSLDEAAFEGCQSPLTLKVKRGKHSFEVRATDAAGNVDATPRVQKFKVTKKG